MIIIRASKYFNILKSEEWLNNIISTEFEKYKEERSKESKDKVNQLVWPLFAAVTSFSFAFYITKPLKIIIISVGYIAVYYLIELIKKLYLTYKENNQTVSAKIKPSETKKTVNHFNCVIVNQVLLASSFVNEASESIIGNNFDKPTKHYFRHFVYESLRYLKKSAFEFRNIVFNNFSIIQFNGIDIDSYIEDYRFYNTYFLFRDTCYKINELATTNEENENLLNRKHIKWDVDFLIKTCEEIDKQLNLNP